MSLFLASGLLDAIVRNWALISIFATLLVLVVVPLLILNKYVKICLNILRDTEPPLLMRQFGFSPMDGEDKDFFAPDGVRLRATLYEADPDAGPPKGLILFAPEFKSSRGTAARYCRPLWQAGYDILSFDFRGQGDAASEEGYQPRQWASDREVGDLMAAIALAENYLRKRGRPIEIGLFGISRGACACLLAAEKSSSVKAVITDGAFSSDCTLEHFLKRWANIFARVRIIADSHPPEFWRFLRWWVFLKAEHKFHCKFPSVRKALMRMTPRPILFIHGGRDSYIPVDQSRLLYAQSAQPRYLWIVPGAKHNQSVVVEPEAYALHTVDFFNRYLGGENGRDNLYSGDLLGEIARSERAFHHISAGQEDADADVDEAVESLVS